MTICNKFSLVLQVIEAYKTSKDGDLVTTFGLETEIAAAKKDFNVALEK